jgi:hypothetical protein
MKSSNCFISSHAAQILNGEYEREEPQMDTDEHGYESGFFFRPLRLGALA